MKRLSERRRRDRKSGCRIVNIINNRFRATI